MTKYFLVVILVVLFSFTFPNIDTTFCQVSDTTQETAITVKLQDENKLLDPTTITDSLVNSLKKIYQEANRVYKDQNYVLGIELYNQFISLTQSQDCEKPLWQEIRMSLSHMGVIYHNSFNYHEVIQLYKKALEITLKYKPNDFENIYFFLFNIASNYYSVNDYNNSLDYSHQAESLFQTSNSFSIDQKAPLYNNIAICYLRLGKNDESLENLQSAVYLWNHSKDVGSAARNYNNIGLVYQQMKQFNLALKYFNYSLSIYDSLNNQESSAFTLNNLGNLYLAKESLDSSKYYYRRSQLLRESLKIEDKIGLIQSYNNLSYTFQKENSLDSAQIYNSKAININGSLHDVNQKNNLFSIRDYLVSMTNQIAINISQFEKLKEDKFLIDSFEIFNKTVELLIDQVIILNTILSTNVFVNENKRFFDLSMISAHLLDSIRPSDCLRTLIVSESYKSLSLINPITIIQNLQNDTISNSQFRNLNNYYNWQQILLTKQLKGNIQEKPFLIDSLLKATSLTVNLKFDYYKILKSNILNYFKELPDSLVSICNRLNDKLLVDYYTTSNQLVIHTISNSGIVCKILPLDNNLQDAIKGYPRSIKALDKEASLIFNRILSSNLLAPICSSLTSHKNISFIPDDRLAQIPFETLTYDLQIQYPPHYIVQEKNISYRFSILKRNYLNKFHSNNYSSDFFGIAPYEILDSSIQSLANTAREINDIARLYKSRNLRAVSLIGSKATYPNFANIQNFNSKIVHISTHSYINNNNSPLSFLELFSESKQNRIFLPAISSIPLHSELLVLNSCETASNLIESSTGFVSFIRSLSNNSIQNFVGTLWRIYDNPSYIFILAFYENLLKGSDYISSLSQAKNEFIKSNTFNNPVFWSPIIIYENN